MVVFVTCKHKDDPIKNEDARVFTTLYVYFSDAQGQLTPILPAKMKKIRSKMKTLEY